MRNIDKAIQEGKKIIAERNKLDLSPSEIFTIMERCRKHPKDAMIDAVVEGYYAGLAVGMKAASDASRL